jgi:hypothetical protein
MACNPRHRPIHGIDAGKNGVLRTQENKRFLAFLSDR